MTQVPDKCWIDLEGISHHVTQRESEILLSLERSQAHNNSETKLGPDAGKESKQDKEKPR